MDLPLRVLALVVNPSQTDVSESLIRRVGANGPQVKIGYRGHISADMEKGADARTLFAEIFENCGNLWKIAYSYFGKNL